MASGAISPGGIKLNRPGGSKQPNAGGISYADGNWRAFSGHANVDVNGPLNASGARVAQTRGVRNARKDAKTTGVTYNWTLPTVPATSTAVVSGGTTATASFTPDLAGTYVLRCVVTFTGSGKTQTVNFTYVSA